MDKKYYYRLCLEEIEKIKRSGKRPTLGIHVCCGPCAAFPLEFLASYFHIVILYANSNIYPSEEYRRRLSELKRYVDIFNARYGQDAEIVEFDYDNESYNRDLLPYAQEKEGGMRCRICFEKRMDLSYAYADAHGFDYFTTVMTVSRQKNSAVLNEIGERLSHKYQTKYFYSDFKKNHGLERGIEIRKEYGMYNQHYCGCVFSYGEYLKREEKDIEDRPE